MLLPAYLYKEEVQRKYAESVHQDHFKYYVGESYSSFELEIDNHDYNRIQYVSVGTVGEVLGYFANSINRESKVCYAFGAMNFSKKLSAQFSIDFLEYAKLLRDKYGASKFEFLAVKGSPANKLYDKFIDKYGGRIVGIKTKTSLLTDGKLYDAVLYEIMREDMNF